MQSSHEIVLLNCSAKCLGPLIKQKPLPNLNLSFLLHRAPPGDVKSCYMQLTTGTWPFTVAGYERERANSRRPVSPALDLWTEIAGRMRRDKISPSPLPFRGTAIQCAGALWPISYRFLSRIGKAGSHLPHADCIPHPDATQHCLGDLALALVPLKVPSGVDESRDVAQHRRRGSA
jgi:hypothetical protein